MANEITVKLTPAQLITLFHLANTAGKDRSMIVDKYISNRSNMSVHAKNVFRETFINDDLELFEVFNKACRENGIKAYAATITTEANI